MCQIEVFIEKFKKRFRGVDLEYIFMNGFCYYFAVILRELFKGGEIYYDVVEGHFVYRYKGSFYDIRGEVDINLDILERLIRLETIKQKDVLHYERILNDCVFLGIKGG